ncbi:hypothetical protein CDZ97_10200 [Mameliella alba]|uniref:hypothetical protein n=1 Tax=Mameliella alba TaxID=561184 RepID=UPI000B53289A|nr:hypothetical protein [Mameliella alba]OWV64251.1 hypothetical protein CDZ97_10200 [Mameliella alba]
MSMQLRQIGDLVKVVRAVANIAATAGGTGDDTEVEGTIFDRAAMGHPSTAVLAVPYTATLAEGETLTIDYTVQEGDESDLADAATLKTGSVVVATGGSGGSTETGCLEVDLKTIAGGRYNRVDLTPGLSAANTDTAALSAVLVYAGMDRLPQ